MSQRIETGQIICEGDRWSYPVGDGAVETVAVSDSEAYEDQFGQTKYRVEARREDTGQQGWFLYGLGHHLAVRKA